MKFNLIFQIYLMLPALLSYLSHFFCLKGLYLFHRKSHLNNLCIDLYFFMHDVEKQTAFVAKIFFQVIF